MRGTRRVELLLAAAVLIASGVVAHLADPAGADPPAPPTAGQWDWPTYGRSAQHTFSAPTTLDATSVRTLAPAWFFPTGDAVTANPIVVGSTAYVGSWDGFFYALDRTTGQLRWKFQIAPQPAVVPRPGQFPREPTSDGGLITSSAWFQPGAGARPDLVIFGGGYTLYALRASDGTEYWHHDYTGLPEAPADPAHDEARIFSSPVVVGSRVLFGVTSDGQDGHRGYIAAANLATGGPLWRFETDVDDNGTVLNDGCGGVWSSPTVDAAHGVVVLDVADCNNQALGPYNERVLALRIANGAPAWVFTPPRVAQGDPPCDWDFGATPNLGAAPDGSSFLGVGGKDGTYYRLDPATGHLVWMKNVVFGGVDGGFIATSAYDGHRVYGATALGDIGFCERGNPADLPVQEPSLHAFDASSGAVAWQQVHAPSFAPTTIAGGMVFNGHATDPQIQIRDASNGLLLTVLPLPASSDSGVVVSRNALFFGTGGSEQGTPVGVYAYTPLGATPTP
jgi:polyvinyl alcohol dehydrogenase (cytochrome)